MLYPSVQSYFKEVADLFPTISQERKEDLAKIAEFVTHKLTSGNNAQLVYICTHNSRRSHFGQIWAQAAAGYYGLPNVSAYSGGTEATAFHPNAIDALIRAGVLIIKEKEGSNPVYAVSFGEGETKVSVFSKKYDDAVNPKEGFCAIMTCTEADGTCPFVEGAELRIATPYEDPKISDNTPEQAAVYDERCLQIAKEILWTFSQVKV